MPQWIGTAIEGRRSERLRRATGSMCPRAPLRPPPGDRDEGDVERRERGIPSNRSVSPAARSRTAEGRNRAPVRSPDRPPPPVVERLDDVDPDAADLHRVARSDLLDVVKPAEVAPGAAGATRRTSRPMRLSDGRSRWS